MIKMRLVKYLKLLKFRITIICFNKLLTKIIFNNLKINITTICFSKLLIRKIHNNLKIWITIVLFSKLLIRIILNYPRIRMIICFSKLLSKIIFKNRKINNKLPNNLKINHNRKLGFNNSNRLQHLWSKKINLIWLNSK